jgi:hypothetical protein
MKQETDRACEAAESMNLQIFPDFMAALQSVEMTGYTIQQTGKNDKRYLTEFDKYIEYFHCLLKNALIE